MMKHVFLAAAVICLIVSFSLSSFHLTRSAQRRIYWASACLAAVSGFLAAYPNSHTGLGIGGIFFGTMTFVAYGTTPYIKIGGKIYALTVADSQPDPEDAPPTDTSDPQFDPTPDSYNGLLTAAKTWWMLVGITVIAAANAYAFLFSNGKAGVAAMGSVFLVLLAIGAGYGDGSWTYPIARRQYLQFGAASLITAGSFALLYLAAYYTARRLPLRREQSMEYRAHPRHRKTEQ
jgi:hypothetical protein